LDVHGDYPNARVKRNNGLPYHQFLSEARL